MRQKTLWIGVLLATAGAVALFLSPQLLGERAPTEVPSVVVVHSEIEGVLPEIRTEVPLGTTALQLLDTLSQERGFELRVKEYAGLGSLVEQIGEYKNGTDGKYWQYYINNILAPVGASAYEVRWGDSVVWKFTVPDESL